MNDQFLGALPEGFAMALTRNIYAMHHFAAMPESQRRNIIEQARQVSSREEMDGLVNGLIPH